jgi:hypothetical protein
VDIGFNDALFQVRRNHEVIQPPDDISLTGLSDHLTIGKFHVFWIKMAERVDPDTFEVFTQLNCFTSMKPLWVTFSFGGTSYIGIMGGGELRYLMSLLYKISHFRSLIWNWKRTFNRNRG